MVSCPKFGTLYTMNAIFNSAKYCNRAYNRALNRRGRPTLWGRIQMGAVSNVPPRTTSAHTKGVVMKLKRYKVAAFQETK